MKCPYALSLPLLVVYSDLMFHLPVVLSFMVCSRNYRNITMERNCGIPSHLLSITSVPPYMAEEISFRLSICERRLCSGNHLVFYLYDWAITSVC